MTTLLLVLPDELPTPSIARTTSIPSTTDPKTTCLPSNHPVSAVHKKNWLPFVPGPAIVLKQEHHQKKPNALERIQTSNDVTARNTQFPLNLE